MRSGGPDTLPRALTGRAVEDVPGAAAGSVTVRRDGRLPTLTGGGEGASPPPADWRPLPAQRPGPACQYEDGVGPCVTAAEIGAEQYSPIWPPRPAGPRTRRTRCPAGSVGAGQGPSASGAYGRSRSS